MASIGNEKNGSKRILFYDSRGKRQTIRLGKVPKRIAQTAKFHIEGLMAATIAGHSPEQETAQWLAGLDDVIYKRIVNVGLVASRPKQSKVLLGGFLNEYLESRTDIKLQTKRNLQQCIKKLNEFFGHGKPLFEIIEGDADAYLLWLREKNLAPATISKQIKTACQFFKAALRKRYIEKNPFEDIKAGKQTNTERNHFIARKTVNVVLEACLNTQWKLVFAFARYGGVRIPSEIKGLKWSDVNWERGRITIKTPKTSHIDGHQTKVIPLFPELRPLLEKAFEEAVEGEEFVFPLAIRTTNLRTHARRIIMKAGEVVWPKPFQNLRASRANELIKEYPAHVVCAWMGHTPAVAEAHYLKVTESDFMRASGEAARNPARSASVSDHQGPSHETRIKENPAKANNTKKQVPPAGIQCHKTRRKVYWATVGNKRPHVVSLVIDNNSSFLARPRPLICHTYATQIWSTSSVEF
ncbi:MAG: tyrosine-type recombinase/integrase [Pirellulales bacterium]